VARPWTLCRGSKPDLDPAVAIVKPRPRGTRPGRSCSKLQRPRPSCQRAGGEGQPCQVPALAAELRSQAHQPALYVDLWLDHMKALTKGSASSKRAAADQGGPGLPTVVRGARRASTPSMQRLTSHANSTTPPAEKRPTPRASANSSRS
jgi:hypothetical protein